MLARGPQRDLALFDLRDDGVRLHRVLVDGGKDVLPLDDEVGSREDSLDLAAIDVVPVADVPSAGASSPSPWKSPGRSGPSFTFGAFGAKACSIVPTTSSSS